MTDKLFDPTTQGAEHKQPEPYQRGVNPEAGAGQEDFGTAAPRREKDDCARPTTSRRRIASSWTGATTSSRWCRCCPRGRRLEQGATYVDLREPARREFTATGEMQVPSDGLYVPKSEVDDHTWNRLLGKRIPERMGHAVRTPG